MTQDLASVSVDPRSTAAIRAEFKRRLGAEMQLRIDGQAKANPAALLRRYAPRYRFALNDTEFYLSQILRNPDLRFCVAYVVQPDRRGHRRCVARLLYKDVSLVWRSASHVIVEEDGFWIGKGDVRTSYRDGYELEESAEETTDLPFEVQCAMETINQSQGHARYDKQAIAMVLRNAPVDRIMPYRDFYGPRRAAAADPRQLINRGKPVAWFEKTSDPASLRFTPGYAPDFDKVLERWDQTECVLRRPRRALPVFVEK